MNSATFRNLKWIYFVSFLFQAILLLVILVVTLERGDTKIPGEWNYFLFPLGLMLTLMVIVVGNIIYRNILKKAKQVDEIVAKLDKYKFAVLVRLGLLEGINILMIFFYYLTSNYGYFAMITALFFIFSISKPSKKTAKKDLAMFSR